MPKPRIKDKGLPSRVYPQHGAYRYFAKEPMLDKKDGKLKRWHTLCRLEDGNSAMLVALADLLDEKSYLHKESMVYLCSEYITHRLGDYEPDTVKQYTSYLNIISDAFKQYQVNEVTTQECAAFIHFHFSEQHNTARKYAALMTKLFKYAISSLGLRKDNPMQEIELGDYKRAVRTVSAQHGDIAKIRQGGVIGSDGRKNPAGEMFTCIIDMSYLCWQRAKEIRTLNESQIIDDTYLRFKPGKTEKTSGEMVDILITPEIRAVLDRARAIKVKYANNHKKKYVETGFIFCQQNGSVYAASGLKTMWKRAKNRSEVKGVDVTFKDIRARAATDANNANEAIENIQTRLVHTSEKTTKIYLKEKQVKKSGLESKLPWEAV